MPRGGKREGAGRKPGAAWKPKRPPAVRRAANARIRSILIEGHDPLSVLLGIAEDTAVKVELRVQAAAAAAPYCYPRLSMVAVADATQRLDRPDPRELLERLNAQLARLGAAGGRAAEHATIDADAEEAA